MENKIVFTGETLKIMSLFEKITGASAKDCFVDQNEILTFVVPQGQIGRAVGKKASNVKRIEQLLNRKIKIVEFNPDMLGFINNLIFPLMARDIAENDGIVTIQSPDLKTRGLLIGRNAKNLRNFEEITKKYYPQLKEIKIA